MTIKHTLLLMAFAGFALTACQPKQASSPTAAVSATETPDSNEISLADAKKYVAQYGMHAGKVDTIVEGKPVELENTRAVFFDTTRIIKLLAKLRKEKGDGIRFYLARYDAKVGQNSTFDPKYAGYNTLVLVSTKDSVNKQGQHFHRDSYTSKTANGPGGGFIVGAGPENRGEMCPPPRDCPSIGATLIQ